MKNMRLVPTLMMIGMISSSPSFAGEQHPRLKQRFNKKFGINSTVKNMSAAQAPSQATSYVGATEYTSSVEQANREETKTPEFQDSGLRRRNVDNRVSDSSSLSNPDSLIDNSQLDTQLVVKENPRLPAYSPEHPGHMDFLGLFFSPPTAENKKDKFTMVPGPVVAHIFSFLDPASLASCDLVSKDARNAVKTVRMGQTSISVPRYFERDLYTRVWNHITPKNVKLAASLAISASTVACDLSLVDTLTGWPHCKHHSNKVIKYIGTLGGSSYDRSGRTKYLIGWPWVLSSGQQRMNFLPWDSVFNLEETELQVQLIHLSDNFNEDGTLGKILSFSQLPGLSLENMHLQPYLVPARVLSQTTLSLLRYCSVTGCLGGVVSCLIPSEKIEEARFKRLEQFKNSQVGKVKQLLLARHLNGKMDPNPKVEEMDLSNTKDDSHTYVSPVDEKGLLGSIRQSYPNVRKMNLSGVWGKRPVGSPVRNPDEFSNELRDLHPQLTELNLSNNDLHAVNLSHLPDTLRVLDLSNTSGATAVYLPHLRQLEVLNIRGTTITDGDIEHFPTSLKRIYADRGQFSAEGLAALEVRLPGVELVTPPTELPSGWAALDWSI